MIASTATSSTTTQATSASAIWWILARIEVARYARRPAFLVGTLLTYAGLLIYLDASKPVDELSMIAPAALIGLIGITVSAQRVWASDRCAQAAGPTPVTEATRTSAHLVAGAVPFLAGFGFFAATFIRYLTDPPPANGYAALMNDAWVASAWFGLGAMSCLGGPILGIVIARTTRWRPAPIVDSVGVVAAVIILQGIFEPLRRVRVVMPWTYWGGPFGVPGDAQRSIVMTGSPQWWVVYLIVLCSIGAVVAIRHDPDGPRARTNALMVVLVGVAVVACGLAMWTGTAATIVNSLPGSS